MIAIALALVAVAALLYARAAHRPDVSVPVYDAERQSPELAAQRAFLAGVLAQLTDHVVACDADGRLQVFGGVADPTIGPLDWPEFFGLRTADGRARPAAADVPLFRALHGEVVEGVELTVEQHDGTLTRVVSSARPVRDASGRMIGAVATGIDITDRRETETRLRASEERYRSVVEAVEDIVFQTDLSGRWSFLNESWARWSGLPVQDGLGRRAHELVHPDDRAAHARAFAPLVAGDVDSVHLRHRYLTADGVTRWAEVRATLARDAAGRPHGIAGVIEDITERHRTKQYEAAERAVVDVLTRTADIEDGVPALLEALCRNLDWDLAELWTLDPDREVLRRTEAWGERRAGLEALEAAAADETFEVGDGLQGQAWARRTPVWATGLQEDPLFRRGRRRALRARAAGVARPRRRRHDPVLLARGARPGSRARAAAADDRRASRAVLGAPPGRAVAGRARGRSAQAGRAPGCAPREPDARARQRCPLRGLSQRAFVAASPRVCDEFPVFGRSFGADMDRMIEANGVELCTETFGDSADPPVLLIMGMGGSMLWWDEGFCRLLADGGRFVIRYDHRDTGRSVSYPPGRPAYSSDDLVADAAGVLDAYGVGAAHVVGVSMGGALAQLLALDFPERVASLTLISTSPAVGSHAGLPSGSDALARFAATASVDWSDATSVTEYLVGYSRVLAGERRFDADALREFVHGDIARARDFSAAQNHELLDDDGRVRAPLSSIAAPTLVIHGTADPMFALAHGEALAAAIPGATLLPLEGAGHGVDRADWATITLAVLEHTTI